MDRFTPQHSSELARRCVFSDLLGEGQSGRVWRCVDRATGDAFACKQVNKRGLSPAAEADLQREITLLIILQGHPNMLRLDSLYEDTKAVYILTELCDGGDLFGLLADHPRGLDERTVARIFAQVARAVQWCHDHRVVHRDIKPENILISRRHRGRRQTGLSAVSADAAAAGAVEEAEYDVRLGDFGLAYQLPRDKCIVGLAGSAPYEAPEVLARAPYGCEADVWSLGVLLYALLSAAWPAFRAGERKLVPAEDFGYFPWQKNARVDGGKREVSWAAKDLICRMMTVDPQDRIDIDGILNHSWLVRHLKRFEAVAPVTLIREDTSAAASFKRRPEMATETSQEGSQPSDEECYDSEPYNEANGEASYNDTYNERDGDYNGAYVKGEKAACNKTCSKTVRADSGSSSMTSISSISSSSAALSFSRSSDTRTSSTTPNSSSGSSSFSGGTLLKSFSSSN